MDTLRNAAPPILVVDDNPDDIEFTFRVLRRRRIQNPVVTAETGPKALEFLLPQPEKPAPSQIIKPAVVFLDIHLPGMDGIEVLRQLRAAPSTEKLPVVLLSGMAPLPIKVNFNLGPTHQVAKPLKISEVLGLAEHLGFSWDIGAALTPGRNPSP